MASSLYETLQTSSPSERRAVASELVVAMQGRNPAANEAYYGVCRKAIRSVSAQEAAGDAALPAWTFSAFESAMLVGSIRRTAGFLSAIGRAPQARSAIDAGTGASALLAVSTAVLHPKAEVLAYEIHEPAARCAAAVIDLFGLSDRISVVTDDVLTATLPEVNLAVTETFTSGLTKELGTRITTALGRVAGEVLPAYAQLGATDSKTPGNPMSDWYETTLLDLREQNNIIAGEVTSTGRGRRPVSVYAELLDARLETVAEPGLKDLTDHVTIGSIAVPRRGAVIGFSYPAGADLAQTPAQLWVA